MAAQYHSTTADIENERIEAPEHASSSTGFKSIKMGMEARWGHVQSRFNSRTKALLGETSLVWWEPGAGHKRNHAIGNGEISIVPILSDVESMRPCNQFTAQQLKQEFQRFGIQEELCHMIFNGDQLNERFVTAEQTFGMVYAWVTGLCASQLIWRRETDPAQYDTHFIDFKLHGQKTSERMPECTLSLPDGFGLRCIQIAHFSEPRRIWDLCSNRVVPFRWIVEADWLRRHYCAISHSWTNNMELTWSHINAYQWPIPLPHGVQLEDIRTQTLQLGIRYCWLDVVCLRQALPVRMCTVRGNLEPSHLHERLPYPQPDEDVMQKGELKREEEWELDVPTIGNIYEQATKILYFLNGLGVEFKTHSVALSHNGALTSPDPRHWINRAWTLQEFVPDRMILGTLVCESDREYFDNQVASAIEAFQSQMGEPFLSKRRYKAGYKGQFPPFAFGELISEMNRRASTNEVDKIAGLNYFLAAGSAGSPSTHNSIPVFDGTKTSTEAWAELVRVRQEIAHDSLDFVKYLLLQCPHPSLQGWFPSWNQIQRYPDMSLRESGYRDSTLEINNHDHVRKQYALDLIIGHDVPDAWLRCHLSNLYMWSCDSRSTTILPDPRGRMRALGYPAAWNASQGDIYSLVLDKGSRVSNWYHPLSSLIVFAPREYFLERIPDGDYALVVLEGPQPWNPWFLQRAILCHCPPEATSAEHESVGAGRNIYLRKVATLAVLGYEDDIDHMSKHHTGAVYNYSDATDHPPVQPDTRIWII